MVGASGSSRWTDALLDRMRKLGDPVADGPVAAVLERGGVDAVSAIMRTLVRVDQPVPEELPDEIQDYLVETVPLPEWADLRRIKRGQQLFETWGVQIAVCLFCASLPSSYAAANGVKVLYLTARLDTDARRRVMETGQFLIDALTVGGLDEHGKGRRPIQRVRLMHAAVRHLIKARNEQTPGMWHPDWEYRSTRRTSPGHFWLSRMSSPIRSVASACACPAGTSTRTCIYGTSSGTCSVCATSCSCATSPMPPR